MVGGKSDGKIAKSPDFLEFLPQSPLLENTNLEKIDEFRKNYLEQISTMLLVKDRFLQKETHAEAIGGADIGNIFPIAADLSLNRAKDPKVAIRVVYGGTREMPFRALGYILPALVFAENMGVGNAQVQIIFPNNITSSLNALPPDVVLEQSTKFSKVAKRYIQNFFPDLEESVVFLEDTPLQKNSLLRSELIRMASVLRDNIPDNLKKELEQKGSSARSRINSFYGAAHLLIHDLDLPGTLIPLLSDQSVAINPSSIINIGGNKEQLFYKLRQAIKANFDPNYFKIKTFQFFTRHMVPPYTMTRIGEDISLDSVLRGKEFKPNSLAKTVQYDFDYIFNITNSRGNLTDFISREKGLYEK